MESSRLPSPERQVLLVNGDRLIVTAGPDGRKGVAMRTARKPDAIITLRSGGQVLEIPLAALPYLDRGLSPSLFSLAALEKAESGGRLPVQVAFTGRRPAIPGLTITRSGPGHAAGYLTAASARVFGAALWRQFAADHARGSYGTDGLFSGGVSIALAGTPLTAPARPAFPMHTLTVRGTNLRGRPDNGDMVFVTSADALQRFDGFDETTSYFYRGGARFSLPAGHYWAIATFTHGTQLRLVVLPQFTVAGRHTTVHIAERAASSRVTIRTPRPAMALEDGLDLVRGARNGSVFDYGAGWSGFTGWVSPTTRKPSVGTLRTYTSGMYTSPAGVSPGYVYNLDFPGPAGLVPPQHFTVSPGSLAAVTERYYQDVPTRDAGWAVTGGTLAQIFAPVPIIQFRMPSVQTQYFSPGRELLWNVETFSNLNQFAGGDDDDFRWYSAGQHETQTWNAFPLHPAPFTTLGGPAAALITPASAARVGNRLLLDFTPFSDNQFGHTGPGFGGNGRARVTGSYQVDQDGRRIARGSAVNGIPAIRLSARPSVVRFTLTAHRYSSFFPLSSGSQTTWTWRSRPEPSARVPQAWFCWFNKHGQLVHRCAVQPMMTLNYQVQGMSLAGRTRPGPQVVDAAAGHVQLGGTARITGATARVSFNDGGTWFPTRVTARGGGQFKIGFNAPPGVGVTLRVRATDAAGGSISETIVRGYAVSGSAGPAGPASGPARIARVTAAARRGPRPACPQAQPGDVRCFVLVQPQFTVNRALAAGRQTRPRGWTPRQLERAYRLPAGRDSHQTVAVSIAGRTPHLASYLRTYRARFGLPPCGQPSGCLRIVNQHGQAAPAAPSNLGSGWDVEVTLDVSMISAACPHCKILVVEARSPSVSDLARSEDTAARLGAQVISNSYGIRESGYSQTFARAYGHPGHMIVVAAGDTGFDAANFPANLASVTAVGGTKLVRAHNARGFTERVWNNTRLGAAGSSGCSAYVARPAWQHSPHCQGRTIADTSAVAANIPIYNKAWGGWLTVAGTSAAAPLIAGIYGLAGNAASVTTRDLYRHEADFFDVTRGNNVLGGTVRLTCGGDYLCAARRGYDAPTGLGTPDGLGGF